MDLENSFTCSLKLRSWLCLCWVVWGSDCLWLVYLWSHHLHCHLSFPVSPFVGKYWDLSEKFTWWVAVTHAASLKFVCGSGCESRASTRGWNDQGFINRLSSVGLKQTGPLPEASMERGWPSLFTLCKRYISLPCLRLGLCITAIQETCHTWGAFVCETLPSVAAPGWLLTHKGLVQSTRSVLLLRCGMLRIRESWERLALGPP